MLRNAMRGEGVKFPEKKRYECEWFHIISITMGGRVFNFLNLNSSFMFNV